MIQTYYQENIYIWLAIGHQNTKIRKIWHNPPYKYIAHHLQFNLLILKGGKGKFFIERDVDQSQSSTSWAVMCPDTVSTGPHIFVDLILKYPPVYYGEPHL